MTFTKASVRQNSPQSLLSFIASFVLLCYTEEFKPYEFEYKTSETFWLKYSFKFVREFASTLLEFETEKAAKMKEKTCEICFMCADSIQSCHTHISTLLVFLQQFYYVAREIFILGRLYTSR